MSFRTQTERDDHLILLALRSAPVFYLVLAPS